MSNIKINESIGIPTQTQVLGPVTLKNLKKRWNFNV